MPDKVDLLVKSLLHGLPIGNRKNEGREYEQNKSEDVYLIFGIAHDPLPWQQSNARHDHLLFLIFLTDLIETILPEAETPSVTRQSSHRR
ncbi:MAG TPA: hypothetical protein VFH31_11225 [Pyrinomonadaceae bacterium]|nr:hypothetical protein [Pyrinomonadaceae bacterium]